MSKEGLQQVIQQEHLDSEMVLYPVFCLSFFCLQSCVHIMKCSSQGNLLSTEDLRDLFTFHENSRCVIVLTSLVLLIYLHLWVNSQKKKKLICMNWSRGSKSKLYFQMYYKNLTILLNFQNFIFNDTNSFS